MKYLIEFTVLFSVVIIYYLQLANKQDTTLGNLVYIPLIILSIKYPMAAFIGLICVILYNQQTIEGFTGNTLDRVNTSQSSTESSDASAMTQPVQTTQTTTGTETTSENSTLTQVNGTQQPTSTTGTTIRQYFKDLQSKSDKEAIAKVVQQIKLSREQIRVMTTRVDGDDLAKIFAIFDVTRQISDKLSVLVKKRR